MSTCAQLQNSGGGREIRVAEAGVRGYEASARVRRAKIGGARAPLAPPPPGSVALASKVNASTTLLQELYVKVSMHVKVVYNLYMSAL